MNGFDIGTLVYIKGYPQWVGAIEKMRSTRMYDFTPIIIADVVWCDGTRTISSIAIDGLVKV